MLYTGVLITALIAAFFYFRAVNSRRTFMKAALYHYFMNDRDAIDEVRGQNAPVPSRAYGMAIHKFKDMHHSRKDYSFCCEVLNRQEQAFEGRKAMLQAARQRHFPK